MEPLLAGRVALVTGAGSGIGRAVALRFAQEGADVGVLDLNESTAEETTAAVVALGRRAAALRADVSRADDVESAVSRAESRLGPIDVAVALFLASDPASYVTGAVVEVTGGRSL